MEGKGSSVRIHTEQIRPTPDASTGPVDCHIICLEPISIIAHAEERLDTNDVSNQSFATTAKAASGWQMTPKKVPGTRWLSLWVHQEWGKSRNCCVWNDPRSRDRLASRTGARCALGGDEEGRQVLAVIVFEAEDDIDNAVLT